MNTTPATYINLTGHPVNYGGIIPPAGEARIVEEVIGDFRVNPRIEGLPEPSEGTMLITAQVVARFVWALWNRQDVVYPVRFSADGEAISFARNPVPPHPNEGNGANAWHDACPSCELSISSCVIVANHVCHQCGGTDYAYLCPNCFTRWWNSHIGC